LCSRPIRIRHKDTLLGGASGMRLRFFYLSAKVL